MNPPTVTTSIRIHFLIEAQRAFTYTDTRKPPDVNMMGGSPQDSLQIKRVMGGGFRGGKEGAFGFGRHHLGQALCSGDGTFNLSLEW